MPDGDLGDQGHGFCVKVYPTSTRFKSVPSAPFVARQLPEIKITNSSVLHCALIPENLHAAEIGIVSGTDPSRKDDVVHRSMPHGARTPLRPLTWVDKYNSGSHVSSEWGSASLHPQVNLHGAGAMQYDCKKARFLPYSRFLL